ncbi:MAG: DUF2752 domain-containing protein [Clostridia bacterium]|nr:DUF2752 domain-containing protein [Clostridia bacterium]
MKKIFRLEKILVLGGLAAAVIICRIFQIPCLYKAISGIPCPTCGITRAYLALLRLDIQAAFAYHPLFWTVPILFLFYLFDGKIFSKKALNIMIPSVIVALFFIRWIILIV